MASQEDISATEVKSLYEKHGLEGIKIFCQEQIDGYKKQPVKIAVTGQSGAGKSSLINRLRNFTPKDRKDKLYAPVGVTDTTEKIISYSFPDNPLIIIDDLPGAGTAKFPIETYAADMDFGKYDAFVILTKDRFLECDKRIATMIKEGCKKPFFFARTKMDATMTEEAKNKQDDFNADETEEKIRKVCKDELADRADRKIYLLAEVSAIKIEAGETEGSGPNKVTVNFPDNAQLKEDIRKSLDGLQKTAFVFSMTSASKTMIEMKAEELDARIPWCALASAVGGAVPVPGVSASMDIAIIASESNFQKKQLLIDKATMKIHKEAYGDKFSEILMRIVSPESHIFIPMAGKMIPAIAARIAASEVLESAVSVVPILGSIIGASVSAGLTFKMLNEMLKSHKEIALCCLDVRNEIDIEGKLSI